jgi:ankyrin repeat protein
MSFAATFDADAALARAAAAHTRAAHAILAPRAAEAAERALRDAARADDAAAARAPDARAAAALAARAARARRDCEAARRRRVRATVLEAAAAARAAADAELAALDAADAAAAAEDGERDADLFLSALFIVAQVPGGQVAEKDKCCYAFDVRKAAGLCRATWAEEGFWSGLVRVQHPGRSRRTRLMYAAHRGDADRVRWLLARGAPLEVADADGRTALALALAGGHAGAVAALLAAGALTGNAQLRGAAARRDAAVVRLLLSHGADAGARDAKGRTPLMAMMLFPSAGNRAPPVAVRLREATPAYEAVATALLEAGADVSAADVNGVTAVHIAAQHAPVSVLRRLLAAGGSATAAQADGATPLHWAALAPVEASARIDMLLAAGASVHAVVGGDPRRVGKTPLHAAAGAGVADAVHTLLAHGALVDARANYEGRLVNATPLLVAAQSNEDAIVRRLLRAGADVHATARTPGGAAGLTCLNLTASVVVARTLIKAGADVHAAAAAAVGFASPKVQCIVQEAARPSREAVAATPPVGVAGVVACPRCNTRHSVDYDSPLVNADGILACVCGQQLQLGRVAP